VKGFACNREPFRFPGTILSLDTFPDEKTILAGSILAVILSFLFAIFFLIGNGNNFVHLIDTKTRDCVTIGVHKLTVNQVKVMDASSFASCSADGSMLFWRLNERDRIDHRSAQKVAQLQTKIYAIDYLQMEKRWLLGCEDAVMRLWDVEKKCCLHRSFFFNLSSHFFSSNLKSSFSDLHLMSVAAICTPKDGRDIAVTGSLDNCICILDVRSGNVKRLRGHTNWVESVDIRENLVISGSNDFTIRLWDVRKEGRPLSKCAGHQGLVNGIKLHQDLIVSVSYDRAVKVWEIMDNYELSCYR